MLFRSTTLPIPGPNVPYLHTLCTPRHPRRSSPSLETLISPTASRQERPSGIALVHRRSTEAIYVSPLVRLTRDPKYYLPPYSNNIHLFILPPTSLTYESESPSPRAASPLSPFIGSCDCSHLGTPRCAQRLRSRFRPSARSPARLRRRGNRSEACVWSASPPDMCGMRHVLTMCARTNRSGSRRALIVAHGSNRVRHASDA